MTDGGTTTSTTTTPGTTTAPAGTVSEGTATSTASPAPSDWTTGLNDEMRGFVQNKGFKDPTSVLDSYRNLEKLVGVPKERLLTIPEKEDDVNGWNNIHSRLGRPESADKYSFKLAEEMGGADTEKWTKSLFHELGLSDKQASKFVEKWTSTMSESQAKAAAEHKTKMETQVTAVKKEWGAAYEQNVALARRAVNELGVNAEQVGALETALGYAGVMKLFHGIGSKSGEASFVSGVRANGFGGIPSPVQAQDQIRALKGDPGFVKRYTSGDADARSKLDQLHKYAYPDS